MAVYEYKGFDGTGRAVSGIVDADAARTARARLRRQGIFLTEIHEQRPGRATRGRGLSIEVDLGRLFQRISATDLAMTTSQLSTLVGANIPLVEALTAVMEQCEKDALKVVLADVREKVNEGTSLADALAGHPRVFSKLYVNMVRAGESSGALDVVLQRLADYTESQVRLRGKVVAAMIYPALMSVVALGIVSGLFLFVIPKIRRIFASFGATLPLVTRAVLGLSDFLVAWWWLLALLAAAGGVALRRWLRTEEGRRRWHALQLRLPVFGRIFRLVNVSRFCRTLATLLSSGVPILTALSITRNVVQNVVLAAAIEEAARNISEGESIAGPLRASGEFPPLVVHMIAIGERTGELEAMLSRVADAYDLQLDNTIQGLTSLLEPILILFMGGVVALIAVSILLPMLNLSSIAR